MNYSSSIIPMPNKQKSTPAILTLAKLLDAPLASICDVPVLVLEPLSAVEVAKVEPSSVLVGVV